MIAFEHTYSITTWLSIGLVLVLINIANVLILMIIFIRYAWISSVGY